MRTAARVLMSGALLLGVAAVAAAQVAERKIGVGDLHIRLEESQNKAKGLRQQKRSRVAAIRELPEIAPLREELSAAREAYEEARRAYDGRVKELESTDNELRSIADEEELLSGDITVLTEQIMKATRDVIFPAGSAWKYLDDGSNAGKEWTESRFDDSAWKDGPGTLGYGDEQTTVVESGGGAGDKHCTTYFRKKFVVEDVLRYDGLLLRLLRDDGAVVYLNGTEIRRDNMPVGEITFETQANGTVGGGNEEKFFESDASAAALLKGENVLAVEIHQASANSSDISFDLELMGRLVKSAWRVP